MSVRDKLTTRISPGLAIWLAVGTYFAALPVLFSAGNGYFTIMSLVPVTTVGLLRGSTKGLLAAAVFTPTNFWLVWVFEGSLESMLAPGGLLGSASLFGLGWLVGYLRDLAHSRLTQVAEEKDRLIETISHELRTPLTTVVGLSHELSGRIGSFTRDEVAEFCGLIAQQSAELEALLEDLLVAARADIERISVRSLPVDLAALAQGVAAEGPTDGKIRARVCGGASPPVLAVGDELRVRQIVRNLLQNANRYGGDDIQIAVSQNGGSCRLRVSDNGPGIVNAAAESMFAPHTRAHVERGNTESLGLGLYVSRILAQLMSGRLEYKRVNGRTCFDLILPAVAEENQGGRPIRIGTGTA